ncbi:MAG: hypothetical protein ACXW6T_00460, partial [Candidatus Binatia bacterium]
MNDQPQKTAAHEVIQYVSMWIDRHDPEFAKHVALKSVAEIIPLVNRRYKTNIGPNPKPYEFLWSFAVGQARYIDSVAMSKRVQAHKGRAEKAE